LHNTAYIKTEYKLPGVNLHLAVKICNILFMAEKVIKSLTNT